MLERPPVAFPSWASTSGFLHQGARRVNEETILEVDSLVPNVLVLGFQFLTAVAQITPNRDKSSLLCPVWIPDSQNPWAESNACFVSLHLGWLGSQQPILEHRLTI